MFALTTTVLGTKSVTEFDTQHERNVAAHNLIRSAVQQGLTYTYPNDYTVTVSEDTEVPTADLYVRKASSAKL